MTGQEESAKPRNFGEEHIGNEFQPEHYRISTQPIVAAVYSDLRDSLRKIRGVTDAREVVSLGVDRTRKMVSYNRNAITVFCHEGQISVLKLYLPSGGSEGHGIKVESPIQEQVFDGLDLIFRSRTPAQHWQRAKELDFTPHTAEEHEEKQTRDETQRGLKNIMLFQGEDDKGRLEMLAVVEIRDGIKDAIKEFRNHATKGEVVRKAVSPTPLLDRHLKAAGIDPIGGNVIGGRSMYVYLPRRKGANYSASFDALVRAHNMTLL